MNKKHLFGFIMIRMEENLCYYKLNFKNTERLKHGYNKGIGYLRIKLSKKTFKSIEYFYLNNYVETKFLF